MDVRTFFCKVKTSMLLSRNAATARHGNAAEQWLCTSPAVHEKLTAYFGKPIVSIQKVPGKKKSDVVVTFEDTTAALLQNKNGEGNNRGWSADRRELAKMPVDDVGKNLLDVVCLKSPGERTPAVCPAGLVSSLLLGTESETSPTHFTHSIFHKETGELLHLSISPAGTVIEALTAMVYSHLLPKRTCVHISPLMYLQRKGGGSHDHAPNDIQLKLTAFPSGVMTTL